MIRSTLNVGDVLRKRSTKAKDFSGNHQRSWLWGKHAVLETLQAGRWPILEVFGTEEAIQDAKDVFTSPQLDHVRVQIVQRSRLEELSKSTQHQGLVARLGSYAYGTMPELISRIDQQSDPLVVMCDRIQDSFNFGAILRCCDGANVTAVIVGERSQADMTPHVIRSSSGAANYVPVIQVDDLRVAVKHMREHGARVIAAGLNSSESMWDSQLQGFNLLLLGSEAHGIDPELMSLCDKTLTIPMQGHVESLNVAVAAGILLYEIRRQQHASG